MKILLASFALMSVAWAPAAILFSDDFESYDDGSPLYEVGYFSDGPYSTTSVRSFSGSKSATRDYTNSGESGTRFATKELNVGFTGPLDGRFTVSSRVYMGSGQASNTSAGVVAYEEDDRLIGHATILSNGFVNLTTGSYNRTSSSAVALLDGWNTLTLEIDLYLSRVSLTINGVEPNTLDVPISANLDILGDVGLIGRRGSTETQSDIYWDDLSVEVVPEPGSVAALLGGMACLVRRRRK